MLYLIVKDFWVLWVNSQNSQDLKKNIGNYKFVKISQTCRIFLQILWIYSQKLKKTFTTILYLLSKTKLANSSCFASGQSQSYELN